MNRIKKLFLLSYVGLLMGISPVASADSYPIVNVTSDTMSGSIELGVSTDAEGNLESMTLFYQDGDRKSFSLDEVRKGIVLVGSISQKVLQLKAKGDRESGGQLDLIYMTNGLLKTYSHFHMNLYRNGSTWEIEESSNRQAFRNLRIYGKWIGPKSWGKLIGVSEIETW